MGTATGRGERRALEAAQAAIASPLLEAGAIDGARGILINITGSSSLRLAEVNEASTIIQSAAHEDANIIFGAVLDEKMKDDVKITVIATGFKNEAPLRRERAVGITEAVSSSRSSSSSTFVPGPQVIMQRPDPIMESAPEAEPAPAAHCMIEEVPESVVVAAAAAASHGTVPVRDSMSLDAVRNSVVDIDGDDLDVPAFMRKRM
jgi:cell division protein FtsZ